MTDYTKQLVEQRRELHQWPEEGWTEFWTTNYIVNKLRSWGYEVPRVWQNLVNKKLSTL